MTREQAKREIDSLDYYLQNHTDDYSEESHTAMMMAISALSENKGEWIEHEPFEKKNCNICIECSVCHTWFGHDCYAKTNFCPNCGADMRGE